ncbi:MAG: hypothetical protein U5J97_04480 [Trueperaceae bacterium]|nr:hypothetical protein [Trueperaceae bacterium]
MAPSLRFPVRLAPLRWLADRASLAFLAAAVLVAAVLSGALAQPGPVDPSSRQPAPQTSPDTSATPQENGPLPEDDAVDAPTAALEDGALVLRDADGVRWTWAPGELAGDMTTPLRRNGRVLVGQGPYLITLAADDGAIVQRSPLPATAERLEVGPDDVSVVVALRDGSSATLAVEDGRVQAPVRFDPDVAAFGALRRAAAAAEDPVARAERDPTDPWAALYAAGAVDDASARASWFERSVEAASRLPFFESMGVALALIEAGVPERAPELLEAGLQDLAERGYDPRLATDRALRDAYGFPDRALEGALDDGDLASARLLGPYAWRLAAEEAPASVETLHRLADELRAAGDREAAETWRERARELDSAGLTTWVDRLALALARLGWSGVAALLTVFALLWLVLLAKVWRAQSLLRRQRRERGRTDSPLTRAWVPRYASTTEKLVLVAILALAGFQAVLAGWHQGMDEVPVSLRSGTLASPSAILATEALPDTAYAALVKGLSHAQRGEPDAAREAWLAAGALAPALTNRAVAAGGDEELLEAALRADPREPVARHLLGRTDDPSPFHATMTPDAPLWSVPTPLELRLAVAGDWRSALSGAATSPWSALPAARPLALPAWGWWAVLITYASLLVALVAFVAIPRPRVARDAPRTVGYHVGALLVPGSGHADELWGLMLLVPWSLVAADAVVAWRTGEGALGLSPALRTGLLVAFWALNLIGFAVETASYRRRMRLLREQRPELARSYGLQPIVVKRDATADLKRETRRDPTSEA